MKILLFEWKKLWKSKAFILLLLVSMILIAGLFIRNYIYQDIVKSQKIEMYQDHASNVLSQLMGDQEDRREIGEGVDPILEEKVEVGSSLYGKHEELITAINEDEEITALHLENETYDLAIKYQSLEKNYPLSQIDMEDEIRLNEELLMKQLPKENLNASIQPAVFMKQVIQLLLNTFGFLILIVIIGTPMIKEFDDNTIRLTYGLPISSRRMVLSKWGGLVLSGMTWFGIVLLFTYFIVATFGKELSNPFEYPFYTEQMNFILAEDYIQQSIIFGMLYLLTLTALFVWLMFLMKNTLVVHLVILFLFLINFLVIKSGFVYPFLPWSYQELDVVTLQQKQASWIGVFLNIGITTLLLLLAITSSKRREYVK
ncbi:ABC transporter permease [Oceanobacillus iheyensis]|uniref:ABC transporter permease n=1 Tax=Oceanobacillus iheyensis TaxID=182710 RepID=UPI003626039A